MCKMLFGIAVLCFLFFYPDAYVNRISQDAQFIAIVMSILTFSFGLDEQIRISKKR